MVKNTFTFIGILSVLFLSFSVVSAASLSIDNIVIPTSVKDNQTSFQITFNLENSGVEADINWSDSVLTQGVGNFSFSHNQINADQTLSIVSTITIPTGQTGNIAGTIWADPSGAGSSKNVTFTVPITKASIPPIDYNFCEINGKIGDLKIRDVTFTNNGAGDDLDWFLLDGVDIEVEVENTHSTDNVKNVLVTIMVLDENDNDVTKDFEFDKEEISLNTIKDGDSKIATFKISEIPADLEAGRYKVYIKAYSDNDEDTQCTAEAATKYLSEGLYQKIDVTRENDPAVILKDKVLIVSASCGDKNVELPLSIYNLGSDKEQKVLVTLRNSVLGINEKIVIDDLRAGKRKEIVFFLDIPKELSKNAYGLDIRTFYDYDDKEDELLETSYSENSQDDLDKDYSARLEILSCTSPAPSVTANLNSIAEMGTNLIVKATITNNGEDNDFIISASEFESWANLISITPQSTSIKAGEYSEVLITLSPTTSGSQAFKIDTIVDGEKYSQSVSVQISEKPSVFSDINNATLYIIAGIVAVLILIFLVLIIRVSRSSTKTQF